jgi:hypothetical protein
LIKVYRHGFGAADAGRLAAALGDLPLALAHASGFPAGTGMPVGGCLDLPGAHAAA